MTFLWTIVIKDALLTEKTCLSQVLTFARYCHLFLYCQWFIYLKSATRFQPKRINNRLISSTHHHSYCYSIRRCSMLLLITQSYCRYNNRLRPKWTRNKFIQHLSYRTPLSLNLTATPQINIFRVKYRRTRSSENIWNTELFTSNYDNPDTVL